MRESCSCLVSSIHFCSTMLKHSGETLRKEHLNSALITLFKQRKKLNKSKETWLRVELIAKHKYIVTPQLSINNFPVFFFVFFLFCFFFVVFFYRTCICRPTIIVFFYYFCSRIQRFSVIPLSPNTGLIGWVPHTDTLHSLIRDYRDKKKILLNIEHRIMLRVRNYDTLAS